MPGWPEKRTYIGSRSKRIDAPAKVTGAAKYASDVQPEGWLYGMILRSKWAKAKITKIDLEPARKIPGIKAAILDREGERTVRYYGEELAAVAGTTKQACLDALRAIVVDAKELPFVVITGQIWLRVPTTIRFILSGTLPTWCVGKDIMLKISGEFGTDVAVYKSVEFLGPVVSQLSLGSRFTMANMGVEIGGKCAIFEADEITYEFLEGRMKRPPAAVSPDADAVYEATHIVDVTDLEPMVALPHDPSNTKSVSEVADMNLAVDQAFLGSCTNARVEDIAVAAKMLQGRKVHSDVRMIVTPASSEVWQECARLGYCEVLSEAGAMVTNSGCGACPGGHLGLLGDNERCISSSNRNFQGRMGSPLAEVCLASPATVTASAIAGKIVDPRPYMEG